MPKKKTHPFPSRVCKPCWELHYCPYGASIEEYPLAEGKISTREVAFAIRRYNQALSDLSNKTTIGFPAPPRARRPKPRKLKNLDAVESAIRDTQYFNPINWAMLEAHDYSPEDLHCRVFGHICPVFFLQENATETKASRRTTRYISPEIKIQVVKRDGHICQICKKPVDEREIHFDHIIPFSKGGRTDASNLRVTHRRCNLGKGKSIAEIIEPKT